MPSLVVKGQELPSGLDKQLGITPEPEKFYKISVEMVSSVPVPEQTDLDPKFTELARQALETDKSQKIFGKLAKIHKTIVFKNPIEI